MRLNVSDEWKPVVSGPFSRTALPGKPRVLPGAPTTLPAGPQCVDSPEQSLSRLR